MSLVDIFADGAVVPALREPDNVPDHAFLTTEQAATVLGMSQEALRQRRTRGQQPIYTRIAGRIFYQGKEVKCLVK